MYESFFGMIRRPFTTIPDADCVLETDGLRETLVRLTDAISLGEGIHVVTAAPGLGKTLLLRLLERRLESEYSIVTVTPAREGTPADLLQAMLYELGHPHRDMGERELRSELKSVARERTDRDRPLLLLVDEAHTLSTTDLGELAILTGDRITGDRADGKHADGSPLVRVVLAGEIELEEKLAHPRHADTNRHVRTMETLDPLSREESIAYLRFRLDRAGANLDELFPADTLDHICRVSDGSPRQLSQLADHTLQLAYIDDQKPVPLAIVEDALENLRQLPSHWNESLTRESAETDVRTDWNNGSDWDSGDDWTSESEWNSGGDWTTEADPIAEPSAPEPDTTSHEPPAQTDTHPSDTSVEWKPLTIDSPLPDEPVEETNIPGDSIAEPTLTFPEPHDRPPVELVPERSWPQGMPEHPPEPVGEQSDDRWPNADEIPEISRPEISPPQPPTVQPPIAESSESKPTPSEPQTEEPDCPAVPGSSDSEPTRPRELSDPLPDMDEDDRFWELTESLSSDWNTEPSDEPTPTPSDSMPTDPSRVTEEHLDRVIDVVGSDEPPHESDEQSEPFNGSEQPNESAEDLISRLAEELDDIETKEPDAADDLEHQIARELMETAELASEARNQHRETTPKPEADRSHDSTDDRTSSDTSSPGGRFSRLFSTLRRRHYGS